MPAEAAPLLTTKLYLPPPRADRVPRARLARRLDQALRRHAITLLSAPAGFGKSSLLAEWRASPPGRAAGLAWLALDAGDNDPLRFLTYLAAALAGLDEAIARPARALLRDSPPPDPRTVLTSLLAEAAARQPAGRRWVLALDDYQVIERPEAHAAVTFLAEHLPPGLPLALLTRADPPLPLARWRANGRLGELRAEALRFTPAETRRFLNHVHRLGLRPRETARLEAQTEGWPAALQLAALALQGETGTPAARLERFGARHGFVVDYLAGEVMAGLPAPVQDFLHGTAWLDRMCAPLCAAVLGLDEGEAQARLDHLERQNLFVVPLDGERRWYRYHHLFGEYLRGRWPEARTDEQRDLHRRAAAWLEAHDLQDEAVHHWLQAEEYARLAAILPRAANQLLATGGNHVVLRWVKALPRAVVAEHPRLALTAAWVLALQRQASAEAITPYLKWARRANSPAVQGEALLIEAEIAHGPAQPARALELARQAYTLLEGEPAALRALAALNAGTALWWLGGWAEAEEVASLAYGLCRAADHPAIFARIVALLLPVRLAQAQLAAAAEASRALLRVAPPPMLYRYSRQAHLVLAEIHLEWNALEEAGPHVSVVAQPGPILEPTWQALAPREAHLLAGRWAAARGDEAGARAALAQARPGRRTPESAWARRLAAREARLWLDLGERRAALRAFAGWDETTPVYATEYEALTLARLRLAQGQAGAALEGLRARLPRAEAEGRRAHAAENLALQALAEQSQGQPARALARLEQALALAEPGGYVRLFVWPGQALRAPMLRLLERVAERDAWAAAYAQRLLAGAEAPAGGDAPASPPPEPAPLPLTAAERRVVALIAAGLSNDEISRRLGVSLNTVRTHNKSIFRKLEARSRTQAVARARAAGLV